MKNFSPDKYFEESKENLNKVFCNAYTDGFNAGIALLKDSVRINNVLWSHFNHGASTEMDYCEGVTSRGDYLTWDEASDVEFMRLPTKEEFMMMWKKMRKTLCYNAAFAPHYWGVFNERIICKAQNDDYISLYSGGCKDENGMYVDSNINEYLSCVRLWLADEVSEKEALSVKIELDMEIRGKTTKKERFLSPVFEAKPKNYKILSHQIITI